MPTFTNNKFSNFYKRILQINQSGNSAPDATTRNIQGGDGTATSLSLSDDQVLVKPITDDAYPFKVQNKAGDDLFVVESLNNNNRIKVGESQMVATTLYKEMSLYGFRPSDTGYHYPLLVNTGSPKTGATFLAENDFGNGTDPPTTVDVSGLTAVHMGVAIYWYIEHNITLGRVRVMATSEASDTLNFHLFAYDLDVSSNHGDLSNGVVHASGSIATTATTVKTDTLTLDAVDIDANKVVIGFVEDATAANDLSVAFNIEYYIR